MSAIGYIRQSKRADLDVALSYDAQLAAIHRLAKRDGIDPGEVAILSDMGRSGGAGKERLRPAYQDMLAQIETGVVDTVYALSLTRIARSTAELYRVIGLAKDRKVRLVFDKEGILDPTSPMGKAQFGMMAVFAEFERDLAVERAKDNAAVRRDRGETMGRVPYGDRPGDDTEVIVAAFRWLRSLNATATTLNKEGIKSAMGGDWTGPAVRNVLNRVAPDLMPAEAARRGVKPSSPFALFRLLRCPCGRLMTASRDGRGNREPVYRCHPADTLPDHPRPYRVRESEVLPWVLAEVGRYRPSAPAVKLDAAEDAKRVRLEARRARVIDMWQDGTITEKADRDRRLEAIATDLGKLRRARIVQMVPKLDPDASAEDINVVARAMFEYVELGADLRPVRAEWAMPETRAE